MPTNIFGSETVHLYWNMEDYPIIPESGVDHRLISHNIISALRLMGSKGCMQFLAFGPNLDQQKEHLLKAGIRPIKPKGEEIQEFTSVDDAICRFILSYNSLDNNPSSGIANVLVVIAKQKRDSELFRVLKCLSARKATVVLVQPSPLTPHSLFPTANSFLGRAQVIGGAKLSKMPRLGISYGFVDYDPRSDRRPPAARMTVA